jgi:hypothetical protein
MANEFIIRKGFISKSASTVQSDLFVSGDTISPAHVTVGGTVNDFVKGDGSLDTTDYLPTSAFTSYTGSTLIDNYVNVTGDTMTGNLLFSSDTNYIKIDDNSTSAYTKYRDNGIIAGRGNEGYETGGLTWTQVLGGTQHFNLYARSGGSINANNIEYLTIDNNVLTINNDSVNVDFRVKSTGNTNTLFVDASTGNIGIGTNTPSFPLHVNGNVFVDDKVYFQDSDTFLGFASPFTQLNSNRTIRLRVNDGNNIENYLVGNGNKFSINDTSSDLFSVTKGGDAEFNIKLLLNDVTNAGVDTDKFLVLDSGNTIDFRTGSEALDDMFGMTKFEGFSSGQVSAVTDNGIWRISSTGANGNPTGGNHGTMFNAFQNDSGLYGWQIFIDTNIDDGFYWRSRTLDFNDWEQVASRNWVGDLISTSTIIPNNQIAVGTGSGISGSTNFTWDENTLNVISSTSNVLDAEMFVIDTVNNLTVNNEPQFITFKSNGSYVGSIKEFSSEGVIRLDGQNGFFLSRNDILYLGTGSLANLVYKPFGAASSNGLQLWTNNPDRIVRVQGVPSQSANIFQIEDDYNNENVLMYVTSGGTVGIGPEENPQGNLHSRIFENSLPDFTGHTFYLNTSSSNLATQTNVLIDSTRRGWSNSDFNALEIKATVTERVGGSDIYGVNTTISNIGSYTPTGASTNSLVSYYSKIIIENGTEPITKAYGLLIGETEIGPTANTQNLYGIYVESPSVQGTLNNKYAMVTESGAGNVGIGTTTPLELLHLDGAMMLSSGYSTWQTPTNNPIIYRASNDSGDFRRSGDLIIEPRSGSNFIVGEGGDEHFVINNIGQLLLPQSSAKLAIGHDNPSDNLHIKDSSPGIILERIGSVTGSTRLRAFGGSLVIETDPENDGFEERFRFSSEGRFTINSSGTNTTKIVAEGNAIAHAWITSGGTSSDFVKGDGSLDSNDYLPVSAFTSYTGSSQTLTLGSNNEIPFMNSSSDDFEYTSQFNYDGGVLNVNGLKLGNQSGADREIYTHSDSGRLVLNGGAVGGSVNNAEILIAGTSFSTGDITMRTNNSTRLLINGTSGNITITNELLVNDSTTIDGTLNISGATTLGSTLVVNNSAKFLTHLIGDETLNDLNTTALPARRLMILSPGFQPLNRPSSANYFQGLQFSPLSTNNGYQGQFGVASTGDNKAFKLRTNDSSGNWHPWATIITDENVSGFTLNGVAHINENNDFSVRQQITFPLDNNADDIVSVAEGHLDLYNNYDTDSDTVGISSILTFSTNYYDGVNHIRTTRAGIRGGTEASGNTASGFLAFHTDSSASNSMDERMRITSIGNVGIGTSTPAYELDVNGVMLASQGIFGINGSDRIRIYNRADNESLVESYASQLILSSGFNGIDFEGSADSVLMRLTDTGNLGIGMNGGTISDRITAIGNFKLEGDIKLGRETTNQTNSGTISFLEDITPDFDATGAYGFRLILDGSLNNFRLDRTNNGVIESIITVPRDNADVEFDRGVTINDTLTVTGQTFLGTGGLATNIGNTSSSTINMRRSGLNYIKATDASGYFRFITGNQSSTDYALELRANNDVFIGRNLWVDDGIFTIGASPTETRLEFTEALLRGYFSTESNPRFNIGRDTFSSGGAGIAFGGDSGYAFVGTNNTSGDNLIFSTNGGTTLGQGLVYEKMRITSDGSVGIGTTSPNQKLDVDGNAVISGYMITEHIRGNSNVLDSTIADFRTDDGNANTLRLGRIDFSSYWDFNHAGSDLRIYNDDGSGSDVLFGLNSSTIDQGNRVGIGITPVSHRLAVNGNALAPAWVTSGGTVNDFVKGDGSLDSNDYLTVSVFSGYTGGTTNGLLTTTTPDAYLGERLTPIASSTRGMFFNNAFNGRVGIQMSNSNSGNGATAGFVASISDTLYQDSIALQMFGDNYFVPFMQSKGALFSATDINYITLSGNTHNFYISPDGSTSNSVKILEVNNTTTELKSNLFINRSGNSTSTISLKNTNRDFSIISDGDTFNLSDDLIGESFFKQDSSGDSIKVSIGDFNSFENETYIEINDSNNLITNNSDTLINGDIQANSFIKAGGLSTQYLMADGSVTSIIDPSDFVPRTTSATITGLHSYNVDQKILDNNDILFGTGDDATFGFNSSANQLELALFNGADYKVSINGGSDHAFKVKNSNSFVGINTNNPTARLDVYEEFDVGNSSEQFGTKIVSNFDVADTGLKQGLRLNVNARHTSGTLNSLVSNITILSGSGNGGLTQTASGYWARIDTSTGHTINDGRCFVVNNSVGAGLIENQYGLYVNNLTSGDKDNWAIYTAGTTKSYFGGNVESGGRFKGIDELKKEFDSTTTNITANTTHAYSVITTTGSNNINVTINQDSIEIGQTIEVDALGTGTVTIVAGSGTINLRVNSNDTLVLDGQYSRVGIQRMSSTDYRVFGQLTPA